MNNIPKFLQNANFCLLLFICIPNATRAWSWTDLWLTQDQQAQQLMAKSHFADAEQRFKNSAWQASAAYRAGHYDIAAKQFEALHNNQGDYNQGNALAHMGQYEQAIKAYDRALNYNPNDEDALYNRKIIADLLKKQQKQDQQKQDQQKQDQQQQDQQQQDQQKQDQQKQDQQKQDQQKQDQQKQDQQQQDQQKQDQQQQNQQKQDQQQQDQQKQNQQKQDQPQQNQQKQDQQQQKTQQQNQSQLSAAEQEKQRAKQQWLQLVPDDPGGLLREKFLRDHLRKQNGWDQ